LDKPGNSLNIKRKSVCIIFANGGNRNTTTIDMTNASIAEALARAEYFGYKKPKWWQIWKPKCTIYATNDN
jgi:hypothetical protein